MGLSIIRHLPAEVPALMLSIEGLPCPAARTAALTRRFQKFLCVGAIGLAVNQGLLFVLVDFTRLSVLIASPVAILVSMMATFILNERWTWHDRGSGPIVQRAALYGSINSGGLLINWATLVALERMGLNYLVANLIGAGIAAIWNFSLNHAVTWRE